ncbi:Ser-Thr-rich glycosyl-phosphatidyl-inositol-anchored membrane family-domain-containing protein [Trametes gibbosa]|nr:Ser-Thr-rich glycosyl-phosphatidyl-inositol-anchored membrane family-domain-containing protein [Trametes gibbosa]
MRSIAVLFALAASAFAYSVTEPTNSTGWTISGPNEVSWTKVDTDPSNFTIVLVNQAHFPPTKQVLDALVDASLGKITVNPPSGGWKAGTGFQVNLVKDAENTDTILAQSDQFTIVTSTSSTFSSATSGTLLATGASGTLTVPASVTGGSPGASVTATDSTGALNPTGSDTSTNPGNNGASASMGMQAGLFAGLAFLGAFLA